MAQFHIRIGGKNSRPLPIDQSNPSAYFDEEEWFDRPGSDRIVLDVEEAKEQVGECIRQDVWTAEKHSVDSDKVLSIPVAPSILNLKKIGFAQQEANWSNAWQPIDNMQFSRSEDACIPRYFEKTAVCWPPVPPIMMTNVKLFMQKLAGRQTIFVNPVLQKAMLSASRGLCTVEPFIQFMTTRPVPT